MALPCPLTSPCIVCRRQWNPRMQNTTGLIWSIQVGLPEQCHPDPSNDPAQKPWATGIFKRTVTGPVRLHRHNLEGRPSGSRPPRRAGQGRLRLSLGTLVSLARAPAAASANRGAFGKTSRCKDSPRNTSVSAMSFPLDRRRAGCHNHANPAGNWLAVGSARIWRFRSNRPASQAGISGSYRKAWWKRMRSSTW